MDYLEFFASLAGSFAWPLGAVVVVLSLKSELGALLRNITKLKAGAIEAEFQKLEQEVQEAKEKAEALSTKFDEVDEVDEQTSAVADLSEKERRVLEAIISSPYVMRSVTGVAKDTGLSKVSVNNVYSSLISKGLLIQTKNKEGKLRWYPTNSGRRAMSSALTTQ